MISAYCTGPFNAYRVPLANGARCANNPNSALRVTIVCAKTLVGLVRPFGSPPMKVRQPPPRRAMLALLANAT
jgi:hypothetical protein